LKAKIPHLCNNFLDPNQESLTVTNQLPTQENDPVPGICSRLKFLRTKHFGVRGKRKFAAALGLPMSTYANYEADRIPPSEIIVKASEITGCNLNWLMTGQGSASQESSADPEISEILVRLEKIISTQPKAKQAVTALMDLLSAPANIQGSPLFPADKNVIPVLGRVAAGEPAPWAKQDTASLTNLATIVNGLDAGGTLHKKSSSVPISGPDDANSPVEVIELCEPITYGPLQIDRFIVTSGLKPQGRLFAVTITGESMEPTLKDGDFVIGDTGEAVTNGSIVLAELDKQVGAVCKIYSQESAHVVFKSQNPACKPIVVWKMQVKWLVKVIAAIKK
jgi:SOS-response transcriptional repressor LexA